MPAHTKRFQQMHARFRAKAHKLHPGAVVCQKPSGLKEYEVVTTHRPCLRPAKPFSSVGEALVLEFAPPRAEVGALWQRLKAIEDEKAAPLAYDACKALSLLERAGVAEANCLSDSSPKKVRAPSE